MNTTTVRGTAAKGVQGWMQSVTRLADLVSGMTRQEATMHRGPGSRRRGVAWLLASPLLAMPVLGAAAADAAPAAAAYQRPGETERVSVAFDGLEANGQSYLPDMSADGRFVAFGSDASNLVPGDTNDSIDIFVHDRASGILERVSVASDGTEGNSYSFMAAQNSISADGRFVAFASDASNLVPGDTVGRDIFVHDRDTGTTERVSVASDGTEDATGGSVGFISGDGRYVTFNRWKPAWKGFETFVHDRATGTTERVAVASDGTQANQESFGAAVSPDGRYLAFFGRASNLVPGDTNDARDVFFRDRGPVTGVGGLSVQSYFK